MQFFEGVRVDRQGDAITPGQREVVAAFATHPMLGRSLILKSIMTWFLIDSSMSIAAGVPLNVIGNLGFLLVFTLPVLGIAANREQPA